MEMREEGHIGDSQTLYYKPAQGCHFHLMECSYNQPEMTGQKSKPARSACGSQDKCNYWQSNNAIGSTHDHQKVQLEAGSDD